MGGQRQVWGYLRFTLGLCSSEEWKHYYEKYSQRNGEDPLREVQSPLVRWLLLKVPLMALPTIIYFMAQCLAYGLVVWAGVHHYLSLSLVVGLLVLLQFMIFTPGHDATHGSVSSSAFLNGLVGRLAFQDRKSTRLNSSHRNTSRMPSSA